MAKTKEDPYTWGTGRRKTSVARVRLKAGGTGKIVVNRRDYEQYFPLARERARVLAPLEAVSVRSSLDVFVRVAGGGSTGQSGAISMGIARALLLLNPEHEKTMRDSKFLTRDARQKERKKYGRRGARRGFQFSKR